MTKRRSGVRVGKPHRWQSHGGYSLMRVVGRGELDGRMWPAQAIKAVSLQLADDVAGGWDELSAQQRLLVESAALKAVVVGMMVSHAIAHGVITPDGRLVGALGGHFVSWSHALRLDLMSLGLAKREKQVLDLAGYVAQKYAHPDDGAKGSGESLTASGDGSAAEEQAREEQQHDARS